MINIYWKRQGFKVPVLVVDKSPSMTQIMVSCLGFHPSHPLLCMSHVWSILSFKISCFENSEMEFKDFSNVTGNNISDKYDPALVIIILSKVKSRNRQGQNRSGAVAPVISR